MKKLTHENFIKARDYIFTHSDDINRAWFRYNFEVANTDEFMDILKEYQHENGGFGGLVYEFEYQGLCLKCTEHAFRYIFYLKEKPSADHPVIQKMMKYVLERYRPEIGYWGDLFAPEVNNSAHVWWCAYGQDDHSPISNIDERVKRYDANGQAAIAAFVALYSELVPEELYKDIIYYPAEKILRYYDEKSLLYVAPDEKQFSDNNLALPYNLKCYQQFCDCLKDKILGEKLKLILCQNPKVCMELNEDNWWKPGSYSETPCDVVITPDSFIYPVVKNEVDKALDCLIDKQNEDGTWRIPYSFGDGLENLQADMEAHCTMLNLAELGRFGRIDI